VRPGVRAPRGGSQEIVAADGPPAPRELVVVKLGGTTIAEQEHVLEELVEVAVERDIVVVHGGGKRLTDWLIRLGVESRFEQGLRVTDDAAIEVAVAVLRGVVNSDLVAALRRYGGDAVGLSGVDGGLLAGARVEGLGRVATVAGVRPSVIYALLAAGMLPVVASLALDRQGIICNVNADDAAAGLAAGLHATLVLLTDTDGVRRADGSRIAELTTGEAERLIDEGVITGGMVPKVRSAARGLAGTGTVAVIADGRMPGALARALSSDPQSGTRVHR
jgi:acetylglutamate kinase